MEEQSPNPTHNRERNRSKSKNSPCVAPPPRRPRPPDPCHSPAPHARAPQCVTPRLLAPWPRANLEESSERNKESGAPNPIQPRRRVRDQDLSVGLACSERGGQPTKESEAKQGTLGTPPRPPLLLVASRPQRTTSRKQSKASSLSLAPTPAAPRLFLTLYQVSTARTTKRNRAVTLLAGRVRDRHDEQQPNWMGKTGDWGGLWRWRRGQTSQPATRRERASERERKRRIGMPFAVGSSPLPCCSSPYGFGFQTTLPFLSLFFFSFFSSFREVVASGESGEAKHAASMFL